MENELIVRQEYNEYPGIINYSDNNNPTLYSPYAIETLPFYQTRETLMDVEVYKAFLDNAIGRFRRSRVYKAYKAYLMGLGLNKCQIFGYIEEDMASIEMHHNFLNIHDIALMLTEHTLNTVGIISTFDLVQLLILEHKNNNIPIVMLSKTPHQIFHNNPETFIPPNMTFGKWWDLLYRYSYGITLDVAKKVITFIDQYTNQQGGELLIKVREDILSFSIYNTYGTPQEFCGYLSDEQNNIFNHATLY